MRREKREPNQIERALAEQADRCVAEPSWRLDEPPAQREDPRQPRLAEDLVGVGRTADQPADSRADFGWRGPPFEPEIVVELDPREEDPGGNARRNALVRV